MLFLLVYRLHPLPMHFQFCPPKVEKHGVCNGMVCVRDWQGPTGAVILKVYVLSWDGCTDCLVATDRCRHLVSLVFETCMSSMQLPYSMAAAGTAWQLFGSCTYSFHTVWKLHVQLGSCMEAESIEWKLHGSCGSIIVDKWTAWLVGVARNPASGERFARLCFVLRPELLMQ